MGAKSFCKNTVPFWTPSLEDAPQDAALDHLLPVERKVDAGGPVQNGEDGAEPLFVAGRRSLLLPD
jgi:hypothetical protein